MRYYRKRQNGDMLISVAVSLAVLTLIFTFLAIYARQVTYEQKATLTLSRIEFVTDAMQRAYLNKVMTGTNSSSLAAYPANAAQLVTEGFIEACLPADEIAGRCINRLKLPWVDDSNNDELIDITSFIDGADNMPAFRVSFSLANIFPVKLRSMVRARISQLPSYSEDATNNVTLTFTRPGSQLGYSNLVSRDGTTKMTGNWDYGGFYIDNVKDISFSGVVDRSALTGSLKLGSEVISTSSGHTLDQITCPTGYSPQIEVWTQSLSTNTVQYNVKAFASWYTTDSTNKKWTLFFRSTAEDVSGNKTYFYQGTVAYATWCDFV